MSTKRHLRELQWRLMLVATLFIVGAICAYSFRDVLIPLLMAPLQGERLIYLNPAGGFSFIFLVAIYAGIAVSFPIFIQQIYAFLKPALPNATGKKSAKIIVSSILLLIVGIAFGYFVAVPNALAFLYSFADQYVDAALTAESYLNFIVAYTVGIGLAFQVPLLLMLFHSIKPLTPGGLMRSERWVILGAFVIAAIITPTPDPINQTIIAVPVIFIYQLGVVAVLLSIGKTRRLTKKAKKHTIINQDAQRQEQAEPRHIPQVHTAPTPAVLVSTPAIPRQPTAKRNLDGFRRVHKSSIATPVQKHQGLHAHGASKRHLPVQSGTQKKFSMDGVTVRRRATI